MSSVMCAICDKEYKTVFCLKMHMKVEHEVDCDRRGLDPLDMAQCDECGKCFNFDAYETHMDEHRQEDQEWMEWTLFGGPRPPVPFKAE
jgi:hypothetical protein